MTQSGWRGDWILGLANCLVIGGVIIPSFGDYALAQITPDGSLGAQRSTVKRDVNIKGLPSDRIDGGAKRGANLFHSFREFNIDKGRGAYFTNPAGIKNILSRVTGKNRSDIEGTLGVLGKANLFLINPNGIIFGPNARLDVNGSFVGTTANGIGLANGDIFNTNPGEPLPTGLLNVNPNAFLFNQFAAQSTIENQSRSGLGVNPGRSLLLVGGNVSLDGGILKAPGGQVELGGVAEKAAVGLNGDGNNLSLSFPNDITRADVLITNKALVDVTAGGSGSITINARNLSLMGGSLLQAGIGSGLGSTNSQVGDIGIDATEAVTVSESNIVNNVQYEAVGNAGDINITTGSLSVTNGARLITGNTARQADAGNVNINARDTVSFDGSMSMVDTVVGLNKALGNSGDINITTGSLLMTNGSWLNAGSNGRDAGDVNINARETVSFDERSMAFSLIGPEAKGKAGDINITTGSLLMTNGAHLRSLTQGQGDAGDINITTGSLLMTNGAQLQSLTQGQGDAGDVNINARDTVSFDGVRSNGAPSAAFSIVDPGAVGKGGDINITTGSLSVTSGALLAASIREQGQGSAGSVNITARDRVSFSGVGSNGVPSGAASTVEARAVGNGGGINITAESLSLANGAQLTASTNGQGNGGSINIKADTLSATSGGQILTTSRSSSKAGNITVNIADHVTLSGSDPNYYDRPTPPPEFREIEVGGAGPNSGLFANTSGNSTGQGGDLRITTSQLTVENGAQVTVSSPSGQAGNLTAKADSILLDQGKLTAVTGTGDGAIITLQDLDLLLMRNNSLISAEALSAANGGNITINAENGLIVAAPLQDNDIIASASEGRGGSIQIKTQGIFGLKERRAIPGNGTNDIDASSQLGVAGTVEQNTPDDDPSQGVVALPEEVVDVSGLIAQTCPAGGGPRQSKFVVTGRGGVPPNPGETLSTDAVQVDLVTLKPEVAKPSPSAVSTSPTSNARTPIVEAQGWARNAKGNVVLTASAPTVTPLSSWQRTGNCWKP